MLKPLSSAFGLAMAGIVHVATPAKAEPLLDAKLEFDRLTGGKSVVYEQITGKPSPVFPDKVSFKITRENKDASVWQSFLCRDILKDNGAAMERALNDLADNDRFDRPFAQPPLASVTTLDLSTVYPRSLKITIPGAVERAIDACHPKLF